MRVRGSDGYSERVYMVPYHVLIARLTSQTFLAVAEVRHLQHLLLHIRQPYHPGRVDVRLGKC